MFVQSGGCCAGSTPTCYLDGAALVGNGDMMLGENDGCPFCIDARVGKVWGHQILPPLPM
jgi:uncharacterized protein (DUF779 family)